MDFLDITDFHGVSTKSSKLSLSHLLFGELLFEFLGRKQQQQPHEPWERY